MLDLNTLLCFVVEFRFLCLYLYITNLVLKYINIEDPKGIYSQMNHIHSPMDSVNWLKVDTNIPSVIYKMESVDGFARHSSLRGQVL